MSAMEEMTTARSSSAGSTCLNADQSQPDVPRTSLNSTSVDCVTTKDAASFVTGNKSIVPDGVLTNQILSSGSKDIPTTTVSAAANIDTVLKTTDTVGTHAQATMGKDTGIITTTTTSTDIISATKDTTSVTIGSTSSTTGLVLYPSDTAKGNNEADTPTPSTDTPTTTDVVSHVTDKSSETTTETTFVVPATCVNLITDATHSLNGISPKTTNTVSTATCTMQSTTSSILNSTNNAIVNPEIVTATPAAASATSTVIRTTDIALSLTDSALDVTPKITDVVPVMTNTTASPDTANTVNGITSTATDASLTKTTPAILGTGSTTIDSTQPANGTSTAKVAIAPVMTGAPSAVIQNVLVATSISPSSLSNTSSQINGATVVQDKPTGCSPSLQSSCQRKENAVATSALSLLSSYGISDSEEDCDSDSMDTGCDNAKNGGVLVNGTLDNVTSHVPPDLQGDCVMKPVCEFSSLSSDHSNHPVVQQKLSNGVVEDVSRCNTPNLDIIVSGSYRYTIDVGSGTDDSEDDSSASSSECESSSAASEASSSGIAEVEVISQTEKVVVHKKRRAKRDILLTPGEILIEDLPPIEDLHISVPEEQARPIGTIFSIVAQQVVVEAIPNIPAIDLDSVLFLDHGNRALGQIFDVFGPVQQPFYVVRFNSAEHVRGYKIDPGDLVYFAPSTEHTNFIVIDELMKLKGSDASGLSGNELMPYECQDFSDDEEEARALRGSKQTKYISSTNEFQPPKKRGRGQAQIRGRGRGRGDSQGENSDHNPFRERGMVSRGHYRFNRPTVMQPRFGPRGPQPPPFPMGPPDCMHGPPMRPPPPFIQGSPRMPQNPGPYEPRPFSPFQNQMEMAGGQEISLIPPEGERYHNGPPPNPEGWQQTPPFQFGGPAQFTIPRGCFPSPDVAGPPGIPGQPQPPPSPTFQHGDPPGAFSEMMHSHPPASTGVESVRVGERGWFPQQLAEPQMLTPPERYPPPPPLHSMPPPSPAPCMPPPSPAHSMPPPTPYSIPPPFPSHNIPPPQVAHNMPTLPPATHPPPPPPHQVPFDPTQLPPPLPPATYYG